MLAAVLGASLLGATPVSAGRPLPTPVDSIFLTSPREAPGMITPNGTAYDIVVPYYAIGVAHTYELRGGGTVVDSFTFTVPGLNGQVDTIITDRGGKVELKTDHTAGYNNSPSSGKGKYEGPAATEAKKKCEKYKKKTKKYKKCKKKNKP